MTPEQFDPALELASLRAQLAEATARAEKAADALRIVQNAAKTLSKCHDTELRHLRENATFDHRIRAEHASLLERDALMTEALERAEAERDAALERADQLESAFKEKIDQIIADYNRIEEAICAERDAAQAEARELREALEKIRRVPSQRHTSGHLHECAWCNGSAHIADQALSAAINHIKEG